MLTRKQIRRRFYLKHKSKVKEWARKWEIANPEKAKECHDKARRKYLIVHTETAKKNKHRSRLRHRKKTIVNHKWYCHIHKLWIGEESYCPDCEIIH